LTFKSIADAIENDRPIILGIFNDQEVDHWVVIYGVGHKQKRVFIAGEGIPYWNGNCEWVYAQFQERWSGEGSGLACSKAK
jgi:hypothetical protein